MPLLMKVIVVILVCCVCSYVPVCFFHCMPCPLCKAGNAVFRGSMCSFVIIFHLTLIKYFPPKFVFSDLHGTRRASNHKGSKQQNSYMVAMY